MAGLRDVSSKKQNYYMPNHNFSISTTRQYSSDYNSKKY